MVVALAFAVYKVVYICRCCCLCCCCTDISGISRNCIGSCWCHTSRCMRSSGRLHCGYCCKVYWQRQIYWKTYLQTVSATRFRASSEYRNASRSKFVFFYIFFQTCLIWPNNSLSGHYPTKINMENILV